MKRALQILILVLFALAFLPFLTPAHAADCTFDVSDDKPGPKFDGPISVGLDVRVGNNDLAAIVRESFAAELERRHPGSAIAEGPRPPPGSIMLRMATTGGDLSWFPFYARMNLTLEGKVGKTDVKRTLDGKCIGIVNQKKFLTIAGERLADAMVNAVETEKAR